MPNWLQCLGSFDVLGKLFAHFHSWSLCGFGTTQSVRRKNGPECFEKTCKACLGTIPEGAFQYIDSVRNMMWAQATG